MFFLHQKLGDSFFFNIFTSLLTLRMLFIKMKSSSLRKLTIYTFHITVLLCKKEHTTTFILCNC